MRHGGHCLIGQLAVLGVKRVFTVPGESFLAALDALHDEEAIATIVVRHEGAAVMAAAAEARLTRRPGCAFVTRGPGATNAASGVYLALEEEVPLVLFVGLPPRRLAHLPAFQSFDLEGLFRPIAKWVATVSDPALLSDIALKAFEIAGSGRPGPVVIGLPEDVLSAASDAPVLPTSARAPLEPSAVALADLGALIARAQWPIVVVGGPSWTAEAARDLEAFAVRFDMPVASAFRCQDYFNNRHRCYAGHLGIAADEKLKSAVRGADLIIALGAGLGDITSAGFTLFGGKGQTIVRVHPAPEAFPVLPGLNITADPAAFAHVLNGLEPPAEKPWSTLRRDLRSAYEAHRTPVATPGTIRLEHAIATLSRMLPEDAIVTSGAGNYGQFLHRYFTYKGYGTCLAPQSGSMGFSLPAAIAAKLVHPERTVAAIAGDGCFQMTSAELATLVQFDLPVVVLVANNGHLGTIRMHQETRYPGRVFATRLVNPDFAALARSHGLSAWTVDADEGFAPALAAALDSGGPALIDLLLDPEAITPVRTLAGIRRDAMSGKLPPTDTA